METNKIEHTIRNLIEVFFDAGKLSLDLRAKGLTEHIKKDKTPVTNGDIEVNKIILENLKKLTPNIPIVSEETAENKKFEFRDFLVS